MAAESTISAALIPPGPRPSTGEAPSSNPSGRSPRKGLGRADSMAPPATIGAPSARSQSPDWRSEVKSCLLSDVQQACKVLSREQLADKFSAIAGRQVTLTAIEKWWNPSKTIKNLACGDLVAWCEATGSDRVLELLAEARGYKLAGPEQVRLQLIGAAYERLRGAREDLDRLLEAA